MKLAEKQVVSLEAFARTGKFGPVAPASSNIEDVRNAFGKPEDWSADDPDSIWVYGWYEFFFLPDGTLYGVQNDHLLNDCLNHNECIDFKNERLEIETWFLKPFSDFSLQQVQGILEAADIAFETKWNTSGNYWNLLLGSGVTMDFVGERVTWQGNEMITHKIEEPSAHLLNGIRCFRWD